MEFDVDRSNLVAFARRALDLQALSRGRVAKFRLPGFLLSVSSNSDEYMALCHRALAADPPSEQDRHIELAVYDALEDRQVPVGVWAEPSFTPSLLAPLKAEGIEGVYDVDRGTWQFFDTKTLCGVQLIPALDRLPPWERSFPLRNFLHWAYAQSGARLVHAGSLAIDDRGILLIGAGGSGKSGTTLSGILAGLGSVGDDYIAVEKAGDEFVARPVIKLMKQDEAGLRRNGVGEATARLGSVNWQNKYEFDFEEFEAGRRLNAMNIVGIVRPKISDGVRPLLGKCRPLEVMQQMALSTLAQLPGEWRTGLNFMSQLVRSVPCYSLQLTAAPHLNVETISALIKESEA